MAEEKEPFVASADRPNVSLNPDTPISELRVRDLHALLQSSGHIKTSMEKLTFLEKHIKNEMKLEKLEHKELKFELPEKSPAPEGISPAEQQVSGPTGIDQLIQTISKLTEQVSQLTKDVDLLKQQSTGGHS